MPRTPLAVAFAVVAAASGAERASAQIDERTAQKQLASLAKDGERTFQTALKSARTALLADVGAFEVQVRSGGYSEAAAESLFDDLEVFQLAVRNALTDVLVEVREGRRDVLAALAAGTPLDGVFPDGFYDGDGGVADDLRARIDAKLAKEYASLDRRLEKTERLVAKETDAGLLAWLGPPGSIGATTSSDVGSVVFVTPLEIDAWLSARPAGEASGGAVWIAGTIGESTPLRVLLLDTAGGMVEVAADPDAPRWRASISGLAPGNYALSVLYEGGGAFRTGSVGIR